jgi:purine-binding chemotaxis protein CheW
VPLPPRAAPGLAQFLTFSVAGALYGISVLPVQEVLDRAAFAGPGPAPDPPIPGLIDLRGRLLPVVDLAVRFGLPPSPVTERTSVVIVEVDLNGERLVMGLKVDAVNRVIEVGPEEIDAGLCHAGGRSLRLLDIDRVLSPREAAKAVALGR